MSSFQQVLIGGYPGGGLTTDRKPLMLANEAFSNLQNAYVWRERTRKRLGTVGLGQLSRVFNNEIITTVTTGVPFNLYSSITSPITPETYAQIEPGSVIINLNSGTIILNDQGNGILATSPPSASTGVINYLTGNVTLTFLGGPYPATVTFIYYPNLQVMGIWKEDISIIGIDQTIFFDTKYAYQYVARHFQELVPGTTWTGPNLSNGSNTWFFWSTNYQGVTPNQRFFFTTNNYINPAIPAFDPIRYYNPVASTWTDLTPAVDSTNFIFQCLIIIPYYGRLLMLNTWEGTSSSGAVNYYSRCRFSQIGNPVAADSWRSDIFGLGGFIDAPTNEAIVSAAFFRNTLIIFFEYSTWELRYIGEYGLPFIFERISSDFGAVSTFSTVLFDQGVMAVSDRGIIQAGSNGITRLDDQIPDTVFSFGIQNNAPDFVHGARDYEKELVYWNYLDQSSASKTQVFPNTTLLFNYKNNTWAKFRDTITAFGTGQFNLGITWDSQTTSWDDTSVLWDSPDDQQFVDYILAGNQQGFVSVYEDQDADPQIEQNTLFAPSLSIYAFTLGGSPTLLTLTVPNHNLEDLEVIYISNCIWIGGVDPGINNMIFNVTVIDANTISLGEWNGTGYGTFVPPSIPTYIGGGYIALLPVMNIVGKDFNPFQDKGKQFKLSYIDFQMDSNRSMPSIPAVTIQLFVNSYLNGQQANIISNQELLNSAQGAGYIQGVSTGMTTPINPSNPCTITSNDHSLQTGTSIYISGVVGTTQLNSGYYDITVVNANQFTLDGIDASGFTAYVKNGIWNAQPILGQNYTTGSQYAWYRFYSTQYGQYLRIAITYDDNLMNQLSTHQTAMELNAMNLWFREGGRLVN